MNWSQRITAARKRGTFSRDDVGYANQWETCPTANLNVPRRAVAISLTQREREPLNKEIARLGRRFYSVVSANNFDGAKETLEAIERRAETIAA